MKKNIACIVATAFAAMLLSGCGADLKDNQYLGKVASIMIEKEKEYDQLDKDAEKTINNIKSWDDLAKESEKYDRKREALSDKYDKLYAEEAERLTGKEIPYEIKDGLCYKLISPVTISGVKGNCIYIAYEIELTRRPKWLESIYILPMSGNYSLGGQMTKDLYGYNCPISKEGETMKVSQSICMQLELERWQDFTHLAFTDKATYHALISGGMMVEPSDTTEE